ncbi:hypothetical protein AOLI_G00081960 [Acnodon oligacanthus]
MPPQSPANIYYKDLEDPAACLVIGHAGGAVFGGPRSSSEGGEEGAESPLFYFTSWTPQLETRREQREGQQVEDA